MLNCIRESLACSRPTYPSTCKRLTAHRSWRIERSLHFHILDPFKIILNQIQEIDPMKNLKNVNEHTCSLSLPPPNFWDCTRRAVEQSDRLVMLSNWTVTLKCRSLLKAHTKWKSSNEQSTAVRARWYASIPQSLAAKQLKEKCPYGECKTLSELQSPQRS